MRTGREKKFMMPSRCPVCGSEVNKKEGEVVLRCPNANCPAQVRGSFRHFVSKGAMNIDGIGEKILNQLIEKDLVHEEADLYALSLDDLLKLEKIKEKSAGNLLAAIEKSKKTTLARFIYALGIRHVGEFIAAILANRFKGIERLMHATEAELLATEGIGPQIAESVITYFDDPRNRERLHRLMEQGVQLEAPPVPPSAPFADKTFVMTGTLSSLKRSEAKEIIAGHGGRVATSVGKGVDYLVVGASPGS
jgi:DNA ligase (NAD+)